MKNLFKKVSLFIILTLLSQVGGLIYLLYQPISLSIKKKKTGWTQRGLRIFSFLGFYLLITLLIIPPIAKQFGRVPLPYFATKKEPIQPLMILTCLLNRQYVKPQLKQHIFLIANNLQKEYQGTKIQYLDANFPFLNGFPLLPHLSHDDGEKLDLAFLYVDRASQHPWKSRVSFFGYGFFEEPIRGEVNMPQQCAKKGYWQYGLLSKSLGLKAHEQVQFDEFANATLIKLLSQHPDTRKIFIEPHLKNRLGFGNNNKVRFHGCAAVRHDDHIHLEL